MDTCYAVLQMRDCPAGEREAASREIGRTFTDYEGRPLRLDDTYSCDDLPYTALRLPDLATRLVEAAPGASWYMWDEPEDGTGTLHAYTPERGRFTAPCTNGGDVVLTREEILAYIKERLGHCPRGIEQAIKDATGQPWGV